MKLSLSLALIFPIALLYSLQGDVDKLVLVECVME